MTTGVYSFDSSDCSLLIEKLLLLGYTEGEAQTIIRNPPGNIWVYWEFQEYTYSEGYFLERRIDVISSFFDSINMGSSLEYSMPPNWFSTLMPITITVTNTDNTVNQFERLIYTSSSVIDVIEFYMCGCSENEILCGNCCVNCCDIARNIKESYENILL